MQRVVKVQVGENVGTGMLISLSDDDQNDVILTVCHIFGEYNGNEWYMWDVSIDDIKITSEYYSDRIEVTKVLYKKGDAIYKDLALIYIKKFKKVIDEINPYIPEDEKCILNKEVSIEGYAREKENNTSRVIKGDLYDFVNEKHILYRVNYTENDRDDLYSIELNKGMSGAPVFLKDDVTIYFVGMQKMVSCANSKDGILGIFTYKYCLEQIELLYGVKLPLITKEKYRIINNESLFKCIQVVQQEFDILPKSSNHIGASIQYSDIKELRKNFLQELIYTMIDWVYSSEKFKKLLTKIIDSGKSQNAAYCQIHDKVRNQFRKDNDGKLLALGQIGELLLSHFIQKYFRAVPLLRKEEIRVADNSESICKNAIHYKKENSKNVIILGEARSYTSKYNFEKAFKESVDGILNTYNNYDEEKYLYIHEDFIDEEMNEIAEDYLNDNMIKPEVNLVSITFYNEDEKLNITEEDEIKEQIKRIIEERYSKFDNNYIDIKEHPILKRITYIIFPVWEIEKLAKNYHELL